MFKEIIKKNEESIEIFGTPVYFVNGMVRLKDIQMAYLNEGGSKGERSTDPAQWMRTDSAVELKDYLMTLSRHDSVIDQPLGRRGGWFASRELAHAYAMWLSPIYSVAVLTAFDYLVSGQMFKAATEANGVAKRVLVETWNERAKRLAACGWEVDDAMYWIIHSVAPVFVIEDMKDFLVDISKNADAYEFFELCCNTLETAIYFSNGDLVKAEEYLMELHSEDPRRAHLDEYLEGYNNG